MAPGATTPILQGHTVTKYLIVSYRENDEDWCLGNVIERTDSLFSILDTEWRKEAVECLAKLLCEAEVDRRGRETYVFVNGVGGDIDQLSAEYDEEERAPVALHEDAKNLSLKLLAEYKKAEIEKRAAEKVVAGKRQRERDLRELERLNKKLGLETNAPKGG